MTRVAVIVLAALCLSATVHADVERGDTGTDVQQVQEQLADVGYTVAVDSIFGKQTERAVRHFQRSSGLTPDGVVGPLTSAALRGTQIQVTTPPAPPTTVAGPPAGLDDCAEMAWYRQQAGLPAQFDAIGYRESRCMNEETVHTFCCWGYWQHYISSHLSKQSAYRDRIIGECEVSSRHDIDSNTADDKRRQACVTYVVWSISGMSPWRTS